MLSTLPGDDYANLVSRLMSSGALGDLPMESVLTTDTGFRSKGVCGTSGIRATGLVALAAVVLLVTLFVSGNRPQQRTRRRQLSLFCVNSSEYYSIPLSIAIFLDPNVPEIFTWPTGDDDDNDTATDDLVTHSRHGSYSLSSKRMLTDRASAVNPSPFDAPFRSRYIGAN